MKKRMFVYFLIMTICLFHLLVPDAVFGQALQVFNEYKDTFLARMFTSIFQRSCAVLKLQNFKHAMLPHHLAYLGPKRIRTLLSKRQTIVS